MLQEKGLYNQSFQNPVQNKTKQDKLVKPSHSPIPNIQKFPTFLQPNNTPYVPFQSPHPYLTQNNYPEPYRQPVSYHTNNYPNQFISY